MRRREFFAWMGGSLLSLSRLLTASAQRKVPLIGILMTSDLELLGPFREAFRELGYIEGQTIKFELHEARGRIDRLPGMAEELVRSKVDIIVASQTPAVIVAQHVTRDITICMGQDGE